MSGTRGALLIRVDEQICMFRQILAVLGGLVALAPHRTLAAFETVAVDVDADEDETVSVPTIRPWVPSLVRAEGVLLVLAALVGGRLYRLLIGAVGVGGSIVVTFPRRYQRLATRLIFEDPDRVQWHDRSTPLLRAIGVLYVAVALASRRSEASEPDAVTTPPEGVAGDDAQA